MATKTIIGSNSAIANTILYTHTDSTPLLITGITHKISTPSAAAFAALFTVTYNIYLGKKQIDGSYSYLKLDYPIQADKSYMAASNKSSGSLYTNIRMFTSQSGSYQWFLNQGNPVPAYTVDTYESNELYAISRSKAVINTGDFIYCSIAGTNTQNRVVFSSIITTTTIPQNKPYKGTLFKGVWVSGSSYYKNDTVVNNNDLYIALQANSDTVMNDNNWLVIKKNIINIKPLALTDLATSIGPITPLVKQLLSVSPTLSNKLFIRPRLSGRLGTTNGGSMSLRPLSDNSNLILTDYTETLSNKTVSSSAMLSNCITNVSNQTVTLASSDSSEYFTVPFMLFKPVTKTLIAGTNNITFDSTGGISFVCATTTTAGDSFSIVLPSASTSSGYVISFIVKMLAANQTVNFSTVKTTRTTTASTAANHTDRYLLICDGTYWYCIQTNKGIA